MSVNVHFGPQLFEFLRELKDNNERNWFEANRERYEAHVRGPLLEFIAAFGPRLKEISPRYVADARPSGGSMFRIHRDVRFSRDKRPYKTMAALHFRHERARDVHAPGFYLHLEPGEVFCAVGIWRPDQPTLEMVRGCIVANPDVWRAATSGRRFQTTYRFEGESLKCPPKGYDAGHPLIEELKRKDFVAVARFTEAGSCEPDFVERYAGACGVAAPFMEWITGAVGLEWG